MYIVELIAAQIEVNDVYEFIKAGACWCIWRKSLLCGRGEEAKIFGGAKIGRKR